MHDPAEIARGSCETCMYRGGVYRPADQDVTNIGITFACRRHAPLVTGGLHAPTMTVWPWVRLDGWCGDYSLKGGDA